MYRGETMTVQLRIENANDDLIRAIKSVAKISNSTVKIEKRRKGIDEAIAAYEKEKDSLKTYKSVDEMFEDILR